MARKPPPHDGVEDSGGVAEPRGTADAGGTPNFPIDQVTPKPLKTVQLPYERAYMLATLPRQKWDEKTWAAASGAIAALPSAVDAVLSGFHDKEPYSLGAFQIVQVLIFFGFAVWFLSTRVSAKEIKTSGEYLNELYELSPLPQKPKKWWQFWS